MDRSKCQLIKSTSVSIAETLDLGNIDANTLMKVTSHIVSNESFANVIIHQFETAISDVGGAVVDGVVTVTDSIFNGVTKIVIAVSVALSIALVLSLVLLYRQRVTVTSTPTAIAIGQSTRSIIVPGGSYEDASGSETTALNEYQR